MSVVTVALAELIALGVSGDALVNAIGRIEAAAYAEGQRTLEEAIRIASEREDAALSAGALRTRRYREKRHQASPSVTEASPNVTVTENLSLPPETEVSPTPPSRTQTTNPIQLPPLSPKKVARKAALSSAFEQFWAAYPRKVAKGAAERAFPKALALADLETLTAAARAYAAKVADVEPELIKHASGWLNDKRWLDTHDPPKPGSPGSSGTVIDAAAVARRREENRRMYGAAE